MFFKKEKKWTNKIANSLENRFVVTREEGEVKSWAKCVRESANGDEGLLDLWSWSHCSVYRCWTTMLCTWNLPSLKKSDFRKPTKDVLGRSPINLTLTQIKSIQILRVASHHHTANEAGQYSTLKGPWNQNGHYKYTSEEQTRTCALNLRWVPAKIEYLNKIQTLIIYSYRMKLKSVTTHKKIRKWLFI